MPTFGSLFAGIGGIDLGLERAGWECRWQVEWDPYCQAVLRKHWPDVPRYGDITAVDWSGVEPVDLIAGGFPCQPFSLAGQRKGKDDDRWLWPAFAAAIRVLRPSLVLVENVPGLLAGHGGMGSVLGDLAELGYDAEWDSIPAAAVGAPHLRYRVWIVAYASERPGFRVLPQPGEWPVPVGNGRGNAPVAYAPSDGWESRWAGNAAQVEERREPDRSGVGVPMADADLARLEGRGGGLAVRSGKVPTNGLLGRAVWKTPTAAPWSHGGGGGELQKQVRYNTPSVADAMGGHRTRSGERSDEPLLSKQAQAADGVITGSLNPTWVEWLMGFPLGWTALEPSETPSSRKLSRSSARASSKR